MAGEHQTHDYYMTIGPMFADPIARQLYAEIASIEEQHVTQYESIIDPNETWLEKWLLHEATEVYNYWSCVESEEQPAHQGDLGALPRLRARATSSFVARAVRGHRAARRRRGAARAAARADPATRATASSCARRCAAKLTLSAAGTEFVDREQETEATRAYRDQMNSEGSPSEIVAAGYVWRPGTELTDPAEAGPSESSKPERRAA